MAKPKKLELEFNEITRPLPWTYFAHYLKSTFDEQTARKVFKAFDQIGLPAPEEEQEFLAGTEGGLVFLNRYGIVIRIEYKDTKDSRSGYPFERIDNSPWILKPLASIDVGKAIIEICPGCAPETDWAHSDDLWMKLRQQQGIDFWDRGERSIFWDMDAPNIARIPVEETPRFPEGIPIVIDRLAVRKLTESVAPVKAASNAEAREATAAEKKLYAPLRQSFSESWPDAQKMQRFWSLCQDYARDGKLIAGWNEEDADAENINLKATNAAYAAKKYEARLKSADQSVSSGAPAIPRSPRPPV